MVLIQIIPIRWYTNRCDIISFCIVTTIMRICMVARFLYAYLLILLVYHDVCLARDLKISEKCAMMVGLGASAIIDDVLLSPLLKDDNNKAKRVMFRTVSSLLLNSSLEFKQGFKGSIVPAAVRVVCMTALDVYARERMHQFVHDPKAPDYQEDTTIFSFVRKKCHKASTQTPILARQSAHILCMFMGRYVYDASLGKIVPLINTLLGSSSGVNSHIVPLVGHFVAMGLTVGIGTGSLISMITNMIHEVGEEQMPEWLLSFH